MEGTVIDIVSKAGDKNTVYAPVVEYQKDWQMMEFTPNIYSSFRHNIGEKVELYVPNDGKDPVLNSFMHVWFPSLFPSIFGVVFGLIAFFTIGSKIKKDKLYKKLEESGQIIKTDSLAVEELRTEKGGVYAYVIRSQWLNSADNKVYAFKSEPISYDPTMYLPEMIDVTILPQDPKSYKMDITKIPKAVDDVAAA